MRKTAAMILSLFLMSGMAFADTPEDGDPQPAQKAKTKQPAKPAKSATAILTEQVEALRQSVEAQQQQIRQLQEELAKRDSQIGDVKSG
jgi:TolA-binding protein